jgi:hypothetical protein
VALKKVGRDRFPTIRPSRRTHCTSPLRTGYAAALERILMQIALFAAFDGKRHKLKVEPNMV